MNEKRIAGSPSWNDPRGQGDEDAGRSGVDGAPEGLRLGYQTDRAGAGLQPSHGEALRGGGWRGAVQGVNAREDARRAHQGSMIYPETRQVLLGRSPDNFNVGVVMTSWPNATELAQ